MPTKSDIQGFLDGRFVSPSRLLDEFNPNRLQTFGLGADGIGSGPAATGPFYIFFTCPDLNLDDEKTRTQLGLGKPTAPESIAKLLTGATGVIKLLTNTADSYSAQDITLDTSPIGETWIGAKLTVPKHTLSSRQDGSFQIDYVEYSGLPITLLHKIWVDYIEGVTNGLLQPKLTPTDYIYNRVLDYACSIYVFQLLPDAETIEFGMRLTGCYPTAIPFSSWTGRIGGVDAVKVSVPYSYSFMEPMDYRIFEEFNVSVGSCGVSISTEKLKDSKRQVYKLRFHEGKTYGILSGAGSARTENGPPPSTPPTEVSSK
jgi:hypothetical protein